MVENPFGAIYVSTKQPGLFSIQARSRSSTRAFPDVAYDKTIMDFLMDFNTFSTAVEFRAVQPAVHSTNSTIPLGFPVATKFWRIPVPVKCKYHSRPRGAWYELHWILQKIVPASCFWLGGGRVDVVFNNKVRGLDKINPSYRVLGPYFIKTASAD